jgi:hypothetical protein
VPIQSIGLIVLHQMTRADFLSYSMPPPLAYHIPVRRSILASLAAVSLLLGISLSRVYAQINGVPSSVTSQGFGGHSSANAPRAGVTSLGPNGYAPNSRGALPATSFTQGDRDRDSDHRRHHHHASGDAPYPYLYYPYVVGVPVPYAADMNDPSSDNSDDEADYQGGPTIFDRHGSGAESYIPPVSDPPARAAQSASANPPAPEPPQEPTLLVFNDGRRLEVGNYAIVGSTLFDLTPGHPRKIGLADLDLDATRKLNDDRGVIFQLPANPQAN